MSRPAYVRCDKGPEFVAETLRRWLDRKGIRPMYIEPGSPWQNGFVESFNSGHNRKQAGSASSHFGGSA